MQLFQLASMDVVRHDRNTAQPLRILRQRVEQRAVVGAVDARLDEHAALHAERVEHLPVIGRQGVLRRVKPARGVGIAAFRAADVRVAVAGAAHQMKKGARGALFVVAMRFSRARRRGCRAGSADWRRC